MNKEFIPNEQALALKELGFDEPCLIKDTEQGEDCAIYYVHQNGAPTYSQSFRWFREKYGLYAEITLWGDGIGYTSVIKSIKQEEFLEVYEECAVERGLPTWDYKKIELLSLKKLIEITNAAANKSNNQ